MIEELGPYTLTPSEVADRMIRFESTNDDEPGISSFEMLELMSQMISSQSIINAPEGYVKIALYFLQTGLITREGKIVADLDDLASLAEDGYMKAGPNF